MSSAVSTEIAIGIANESEYRELAKLIDRDAPGIIENWDERFQNLRAVRIDPAKRCEFLVAQDTTTGTIVGAAVISFGVQANNTAWGTSAWQRIEAIAVADHTQCAAVGRQMIQHLEMQATRRGYVGIYTLTKNASSELLAFYESCGFEIIPEDRGFDPLEPAQSQCPVMIEADVNEHIAVTVTTHGRSRGCDWYRVI